jgi:hypothetical protein
MKKFVTFFSLLAGLLLVMQCSPISDEEKDLYEEDDSLSDAIVRIERVDIPVTQFLRRSRRLVLLHERNYGFGDRYLDDQAAGMKTDTEVFAYLKSTMACIGSNDNLVADTSTNGGHDLDERRDRFAIHADRTFERRHRLSRDPFQGLGVRQRHELQPHELFYELISPNQYNRKEPSRFAEKAKWAAPLFFYKKT